MSSEEYKRWILEARKRYLKHEFGPVEAIKGILARASNQLENYISALPGESVQRKYYAELLAEIHRLQETIREEMLKTLSQGIKNVIGVSSEYAKEYFEQISKGIWDKSDINAMFTMINERAFLSVATRTIPGRNAKLVLSDTVWRTASLDEITRIVEQSIAIGLDPRTLAREVKRYLNPGVGKPLRDATRRKFGVKRDVPFEAMRLAVTEMQVAAHEGTIGAYSQIPTCSGFYWRLSLNHPETDICDDYAHHNGDGFWGKDEVPSKPHPFCRCYLEPKMTSPEQAVERLKRWIENPVSDPELEGWYKGVKDYLPKPAYPTSLFSLPERFRPKEEKSMEEKHAEIRQKLDEYYKKIEKAKTVEEVVQIANEAQIAKYVFFTEKVKLYTAKILTQSFIKVFKEYPELLGQVDLVSDPVFDIFFYHYAKTSLRAGEGASYGKRLLGHILRDMLRERNKTELTWEEIIDAYKDESVRRLFHVEYKREINRFMRQHSMTYAYYNYTTNSICPVPNKIWKNKKTVEELLKNDAECRFHPENTKGIVHSVIYHEIGHFLHNTYNITFAEEGREAPDEWVKDIYMELWRKGITEMENEVSGYAFENKEEMVAECFASYFCYVIDKSGLPTQTVKNVAEKILNALLDKFRKGGEK
jgi:hypothetical protein